MTTALEILRENNDRRAALPDIPVGPDLAVGLSQSFFTDVFDSIDWEIALEVNIILVYGDRRKLPALSVVEMNAENQCRDDLAVLPNYTDDVRQGWRREIA